MSEGMMPVFELWVMWLWNRKSYIDYHWDIHKEIQYQEFGRLF